MREYKIKLKFLEFAFNVTLTYEKYFSGSILTVIIRSCLTRYMHLLCLKENKQQGKVRLNSIGLRSSGNDATLYNTDAIL